MDISKRIALLREAKGFTQKQIADIFDMEQSNYSRLEKRGNKLTIEQLEKIGEALGVTVIELLSEEPEKPVNTEEIERLKSRISELEDRVKDKETLLNNVNERFAETSASLSMFIKKRVDETALKRKIGIVRAIETETKEEILRPAKDFDFSDFEYKPYKNTLLKLFARPKRAKYFLVEVILTIEEKREIIQDIDDQVYEYFNVFNNFFFDCGVFILMGHYEDKEFTKLYREHHKGFSFLFQG